MHVAVARKQMRNPGPLVSFTFDDVPVSAATLGAEILGEYGCHGTFYVAGSLAGTDEPLWSHATREQLLTLHRAGHELACHTYTHKRMYELGPAELAAEGDRNEAFFRALDPSITLRNFAYPWGLGDYGHKRALAGRFQTCRSVQPGINHGRIDPHFLHSTPLEDAHIDAAGVDCALDDVCALNGWLIFYAHEVATRSGEFICSPALLRHALAGAAARKIQVASVAEAVRLTGI
ncbi:polysaccharide deacetylase family protein [Tardiphaga alba]|nr:polysaccharide deacetylase family protein [Tardiphaga alba]